MIYDLRFTIYDLARVQRRGAEAAEIRGEKAQQNLLYAFSAASGPLRLKPAARDERRLA